MTTIKSEFVELAAELIGDEFADFSSDAVFIQNTGVDYASQLPSTRTQTIKMIRVEYTSNQLSDNLIQVGDVMLIGQSALMSWPAKVDSTTITHDAVKYSIKKIDIDPAGATLICQCRPL
jgi:hypothetical protein